MATYTQTCYGWYDAVDAQGVADLFCLDPTQKNDCETIYGYYYGYYRRNSVSKKQKTSEFNLVSAVVLYGSNTTGAATTWCDAEKLYEFMYTSVQPSSFSDSMTLFEATATAMDGDTSACKQSSSNTASALREDDVMTTLNSDENAATCGYYLTFAWSGVASVYFEIASNNALFGAALGGGVTLFLSLYL